MKPRPVLSDLIDSRLADERGATTERLARDVVVVGDTGVTTVVRQSPIHRAVARKLLNEQQGRAAAKFYRHWARAGLPNIRTTWKCEVSPPGKTGESNIQDVNHTQLNLAIRRIHDKMDDAGQSQDAIKLMFLIVCEEMPFDVAAQRMGWGPRAGSAIALKLIRSALRVLVIYWGL